MRAALRDFNRFSPGKPCQKRVLPIRRPGGLRLSQFSDGQSSKSVAERKAVRGQANDRATGNARFAHHLASELEVHCIAGRRHLCPTCFKKLQSSADINYEVDFTCAVTPVEEATYASGNALASSQLGKDERFPYCPCARTLTEGLL